MPMQIVDADRLRQELTTWSLDRLEKFQRTGSEIAAGTLRPASTAFLSAAEVVETTKLTLPFIEEELRRRKSPN